MIGNLQSLAGILFHHQYRDPGFSDVEKQVEDPLQIGRRQTRCRLVQQHQLRVAHQRAAHGNHLPLPTRKLASRLF